MTMHGANCAVLARRFAHWRGWRSMTRDHATCAGIIKAQLGGNRFVAMTGAHGFYATSRGLVFSIPSRSSKRPNHVHIILDGSDTYTVLFQNVSMKRALTLANVKGVHAENLRHVFEVQTGLTVSL